VVLPSMFHLKKRFPLISRPISSHLNIRHTTIGVELNPWVSHSVHRILSGCTVSCSFVVALVHFRWVNQNGNAIIGTKLMGRVSCYFFYMFCWMCIAV
jgi:hypothetical protein